MALVLIVDDHMSVAGSLEKLLRASGFDARSVHNGTDAMAFIRAHEVALVLLDMSMPDMSGVEVLRAIRAPGGHPNPPPVVMFSADDDQALRDEAMRLGASGFISKTKPNELLPVVEAYARPPQPPRA